jgi:hypothetical protein
MAAREEWLGAQWMPCRSESKLLAWTDGTFEVYDAHHLVSDALPLPAFGESQSQPTYCHAYFGGWQSFITAASWLTATNTPPVFDQRLMLVCGKRHDIPFAGLFDPRDQSSVDGCGALRMYQRSKDRTQTPIDIWNVQSRLAPTLVGVLMTDALQFHDLRMLSKKGLFSDAHSAVTQLRFDERQQVAQRREQRSWIQTGYPSHAEASSSSQPRTCASVEEHSRPIWCRPAAANATTLKASISLPSVLSTVRPLPEEAQRPGHLSFAVIAEGFRHCAVLDFDWNAFECSAGKGDRDHDSDRMLVRWRYSTKCPFRDLLTPEGESNAPYMARTSDIGACDRNRTNMAEARSATSTLPASVFDAFTGTPSWSGNRENMTALAASSVVGCFGSAASPANTFVFREYRFPASTFLNRRDSRPETALQNLWRLDGLIQPAIRVDDRNGVVLFACPLVDRGGAVHLGLFDLTFSKPAGPHGMIATARVPLLNSWKLDQIMEEILTRQLLSCLALTVATPIPKLLLGYTSATRSDHAMLRIGSI